MFRVTTLDVNNLPLPRRKIDWSEDFFGKEANLTVSGLEGGRALALSEIYTFSQPSVQRTQIHHAI